MRPYRFDFTFWLLLALTPCGFAGWFLALWMFAGLLFHPISPAVVLGL